MHHVFDSGDRARRYGRVGGVGNVAKAAVWLASDESDCVTGASLYVDGGMTLYPAVRSNG